MCWDVNGLILNIRKKYLVLKVLYFCAQSVRKYDVYIYTITIYIIMSFYSIFYLSINHGIKYVNW